MSIRIIAKGDKLFKGLGDNVEVEIHGDEKAFYLKELTKIDQGIGDGARITNDHRDYCQCHECMNGDQDVRCEDCGLNWKQSETLDGNGCPDPDCQGICRDDRYREEEAVNKGY